ncbi:Alkaline phosphatase, tissue-nonspecific isozyme [Holothuria leucospilota]|uniref:Alkaline phosphatase n=1 Tax=Holothuria leucospilota TaxID=206669 RepID=A0A9Q0YGA6_HOLLE|nr:Alkaline phosphatase, tissue-nonspecific isozyme [Holothuria leucospilota]
MAFAPLGFILSLVALAALTHGQSQEFWNTQALDALNEALSRQNLNKNEAKNIIFFLGDGMSLTTVTAARILKGQLQGNPGEETFLSWESFPHVGLAKTYSIDAQVPDSAGTATAFFCGVKSYAGAVGVDGTGKRGDCASTLDGYVDSVLKEANLADKSTGIVSTARLTHATPACTYAHAADRNWEKDGDLPSDAVTNGCTDIASQLIDHSEIQIALGGGRLEFLPNTVNDPEYLTTTGERTDGRNLVDEWKAKHPNKAAYVWNKEQFDQVDPENIDFLFGLFEPDYMQYEASRKDDEAGEPSIADMTEKAIRILRKNEKGFFLAVEGGRIDHAHHASVAYNALHDTLAMDEAVIRALELTDTSDTLIIVTADHSHTMAFAGYPDRGHDILETPLKPSGKLDGAVDGLPYTTLGYLNGPGGYITSLSFAVNGRRPNLTDTETNSRSHVVESLVHLDKETHGGDDVPIYASGPFAHLFHTVHEQHYIAHVMRYAGCLGDGRMSCTDPPEVNECNGALVHQIGFILLVISFLIYHCLC